MTTSVLSARGMHDDYKTSAFFKTPIQEEDEESDEDSERELNYNGYIAKSDLPTIKIDDKDDNFQSEADEEIKEIFQNDNNLQSTQAEGSVLRLASQEPDDIVLENVKKYRQNFEGFVEIVPFESVFAMHEYIRASLKNRKWEKIENPKQESYLNILLRIQPEDRFNKLLESCDYIIRLIILANKRILDELLKMANIEKLPCPFASSSEDSYQFGYNMEEHNDVEANIKSWYMLELIGMWLNFINDPQSFRDKLRSELLAKRLSGISVPLNYR